MTAPTAATPGLTAELLARGRRAALHAPEVLPGPVGRIVKRELIAWYEFGHRFDHAGRGLALIADIENRHRALALGRTH